MATATPARSANDRPRRGLGRRSGAEDGPRASFRALLPYVFERRGLIAAAIVLSILAAAASLVQPVFVSQVIAAVEGGQTFGPFVWALVALVIVSALLSGMQHYLLQRAGTGVVLSARQRLVRTLLRLPIAEYDTRRTGDLVSRVGSDTSLLYAVMTQGLLDAVGGSLVFLGALIAMLVIDPVLLGLTVLVIALSLVTVVLISGRIRTASRRQQQRVGDLSAAVERALGAIRTIRAAGATDRELAAIERDARGAWSAGLDVAKASAFVVPIAGIALQLSMLMVIGVGGFRVATGAISIASLAAFMLFLFMMVMPLGQAFGAFASVNQALGALGRIQEVVELPEEGARDAETARAAASTATAGAPAISLEQVEFSYAGLAEDGSVQRTEVLRGVSFAVPRGSRTALVGPSGAGKSTVLALIERFYDPDAGVVRFDGQDIRGLDRAELRSRIGYVEQDAPVLAGTLRDNLLLGAPDASEEDCRRVLEEVNLGEVLTRSERGLDSQVGEEGVMLSGGERQRLAIARALLAAPPILLLDESTSSLDGLNEQRLREAIDRVAEGRTVIVIAHRLATVVDADQIVVLEAGRVVGVGTHSELVASTPLYRELARHQLLV